MKRIYGSQAISSGLAAPEQATRLSFDRPVAVYYRQSTQNQVGNISTEIQTVDMVEELVRRGWSREKIILIDMDKGVSGTTKIDEREGMRTLFSLITEKQIGAVACQDEDRLFRDVTQIQVNIFIEACKKAGVLVLTPSMIYDFASEVMGTFHARQFRFKSEMAAEYINSVIKGKLQKAKQRLLLEGRWGGAGIPPGFMVDIRKRLPDGSENPNWKRFVPFPAFAEVVSEYFRLFIAFSGQLRTTVQHIQKHGPWYPDPSTCLPPEGFKFVHRIKAYGNHYCPGRQGLADMLTNATYIGHWMFRDSIVRWNNHASIIEPEVFFQAFNYLSPVTLDGLDNGQYRSRVMNSRPSREENRPIDRPLCAGLMVGRYESTWRNVGTRWIGALSHYTYEFRGPHDTNDEYVWSREADWLDQHIVDLLHGKLTATFDQGAWIEAIGQMRTELLKERKQIQSQYEALEQVIGNYVVNLEVLSDPDLIRAVQEKYQAAKAELIRLSATLSKLSEETTGLETIKFLENSIAPALANWQNLTSQELRSLLHALIDRIEVTQVQRLAFVVNVKWRDRTTDELSLSSPIGNSVAWLPEEVEDLREAMQRGAPALEVASLLPDRTWKAIAGKARQTCKGMAVPRRPYGSLGETETYREYAIRIEQISPENGGSVNRSSTSCPSLRSARSRCCVSRSKIMW